MRKRTVIVTTGKPLTREERKNYNKDHPGYRLSFGLRYPSFPLAISIISLLLVLLQIFLPCIRQ